METKNQTSGKDQKTEVITEALKNAILKKCSEENGRKVIYLGNCRLDFSKPYFLNGFTKKGVRLSYTNGREEINVIGKVENRGEYFALYTEGWSYIEHIEFKDVQELK